MELGLPVVLASASPRRVELLRTLISEFEVRPADVDETPLPGESALETSRRLAESKADWVFGSFPAALVLGADTIVSLDGRQFGKPSDQAEAAGMLGSLSGRVHTVTTSVAIRWPGGRDCFSDVTYVRFRALDRSRIEAYAATGEPLDKAGGYAIQGGAKEFVSSVEGSLSNVVGLPLEQLQSRLGALKL